MTGPKPSKLAYEALRLAQDAMELGEKQEGQIDSAKKMGYEALNQIKTHEEICAMRAQQTLDKVSVLDEKLDRLISVLLGAAKIVVTTMFTITAGIIVWLIQTNGSA